MVKTRFCKFQGGNHFHKTCTRYSKDFGVYSKPFWGNYICFSEGTSTEFYEMVSTKPEPNSFNSCSLQSWHHQRPSYDAFSKHYMVLVAYLAGRYLISLSLLVENKEIYEEKDNILLSLKNVKRYVI